MAKLVMQGRIQLAIVRPKGRNHLPRTNNLVELFGKVVLAGLGGINRAHWSLAKTSDPFEIK
jgi:hypothetical protein